MNSKENTAVGNTISLYTKLGWKGIFAKIRFWDAPYMETEKLIPKKGLVVDLGCGEGIFANFLALSSSTREVLGIEIDRTRLKIADRGVPNTKFQWGDATKVELPNADTIILFHVLHHFNSYLSQENVLNRCFNRLKHGGKLIIVEVEPKPSVKYFVTWLTDHFLVPILFERRFYSPIYFRKNDQWHKVLVKNGFSCKVINVEHGHPFTHIILECKKN